MALFFFFGYEPKRIGVACRFSVCSDTVSSLLFSLLVLLAGLMGRRPHTRTHTHTLAHSHTCPAPDMSYHVPMKLFVFLVLVLVLVTGCSNITNMCTGL